MGEDEKCYLILYHRRSRLRCLAAVVIVRGGCQLSKDLCVWRRRGGERKKTQCKIWKYGMAVPMLKSSSEFIHFLWCNVVMLVTYCIVDLFIPTCLLIFVCVSCVCVCECICVFIYVFMCRWMIVDLCIYIYLSAIFQIHDIKQKIK